MNILGINSRSKEENNKSKTTLFVNHYHNFFK